MDESTAYMETKAQQPEDKQYDGKCPKHKILQSNLVRMVDTTLTLTHTHYDNHKLHEKFSYLSAL